MFGKFCHIHTINNDLPFIHRPYTCDGIEHGGFAGAIAAIALWLLGGYQLDGFAWSSKITAIITLVICGSVMGLAYLAGVQIFRVKEANALLAPITSKLERLARR